MGGAIVFVVHVCMMLPILTLGIVPANATDYCVTNNDAVAVDLSDRVDQAFISKMKNIGVKTIIRYYDHEDETIPGKTLRRKERDLIINNGFQIAVVFQHNNNKLSSFTPTRGQQDAERSLVLAAENLQPKGSAIYFGVDGSWKKPDELANIKNYFTAVNTALNGKGYRVGVYGSGLVCKELLHEGLAELCWIANPKSWPGYDEYHKTMNWRLRQLLPADTDCGGRKVDFNMTNGRDADYGQFRR